MCTSKDEQNRSFQVKKYFLFYNNYDVTFMNDLSLLSIINCHSKKLKIAK